MKKPAVSVTITAALLATGGCTTSTSSTTATDPTASATDPAATAASSTADDAHDARNSLDWAGTYRGVLPCADCDGIETVVTLASDGAYETLSKYLGESADVLAEQGTFSWNAAGNTVTLDGRQPVQYFVGENRLTRLALDGSRITGDLAQNYVLTKLTDGVKEKYWKLVELNGQPVPALEREPYLILKAEDERVNGFGGCNAFTGTYEIDEAVARIRFGQIAATMSACLAGMDVETAFHAVLRNADNYSLSGERLSLNRARMAPLARFEVVYLR